jgi:hypothetical protein
LNIYNLILGVLQANIAIKFSECEVPSSFKDFVNTATTASGAGAAAFMAFFLGSFALDSHHVAG